MKSKRFCCYELILCSLLASCMLGINQLPNSERQHEDEYDITEEENSLDFLLLVKSKYRSHCLNHRQKKCVKALKQKKHPTREGRHKKKNCMAATH